MKKNIINIGILAHANAGKTTITENILFLSGLIKQIGSVDKGSCHTDFLSIEKERGISIKSTITYCNWKNCRINIIDTPGHVDFSSEIDKTFIILDCAVLIISAVDGVQSHTKNIFDALVALKIPTIILINKIDRIGADTEIVVNEIEKELSKNIIISQNIQNEAQENVQIIDFIEKQQLKSQSIEKIIELDDFLMTKFIDNKKIFFDEIYNTFLYNLAKGKISPILFSSGKYQIGIKNILNLIADFSSHIKSLESKDFSAIVFKIEHHKNLGKIAGIRLFSGEVKPRDIIFNATKNEEQKITLIKEYNAEKINDLNSASAGEIVALTGISNIDIGDILGRQYGDKQNIRINNPLLTVKVFPEKENEFSNLADALNKLTEEDPALDFIFDKEEKELNIKITGKIQIEILQKTLLERFNIAANFDKPTVIYKETPKNTAEGFIRYTMPKPCWAILKFKIEPGERNSGISYKSEIGVNNVLQKYQNEVERTIPNALKQGIKGWEVTDIKITLIEGEDHNIHSRAGDFAVATPMGIMNGLVNTDTNFLEPIIDFKIKAPENLLGTIASEIHKMRGTFETPDIFENLFEMKGKLPLATSMDFPITLASLSGGKAKFSSKFYGYELCPEEHGIKRDYKGISPLDEAKWILKARKALQ